MAKRPKKNKHTMILLLLVLVLLSGFYIWYLNRDKDDQIDESPSTVIATMDTDLIDTIYIKNDNLDMKLVLEDETWKLETDKNRPINQIYVRNMLNLVNNVRVEKEIHEKAEDLEQYGLKEPYAYLKAIQSDGKTIALSLGKEVATGDGYYAKIEGDDTVYIVPRIYKTNLSYSDIDMTYAEDGPSISTEDIYHIQVLKKEGEDFELILDSDYIYYNKNNPIHTWAILKPYEVPYSADNSKVNEILSNYQSFDFLSCKEYETENFADYGLDDPMATVLVEYYERDNQKLDDAEIDPDAIVLEEKNFKLLIGDKDDQGNYYVRKDGDNAVYTMRASYVNNMLEVDAFSIISKFVSIHNIDAIDHIDIDISGKPYTMEIKRETITNEDGQEEIKASYYYNGKVVEEDVFKHVYQAMVGAKYDTQLKEEASNLGLEPVLTISYHIKDTDEIYTSKYYTYDDSFYLVDNGNPIRFTADKRKIDGIIKAIQEFKK